MYSLDSDLGLFFGNDSRHEYNTVLICRIVHKHIMLTRWRVHVFPIIFIADNVSPDNWPTGYYVMPGTKSAYEYTRLEIKNVLVLRSTTTTTTQLITSLSPGQVYV